MIDRGWLLADAPVERLASLDRGSSIGSRDLRHLINTVHDLTARSVGFGSAGHAVLRSTRRLQRASLCSVFLLRGRVRAGVDFRAHDGRIGIGTSTRQERRAAVQDDRSETAIGHGGDGAAGNRGWRSV